MKNKRSEHRPSRLDPRALIKLAAGAEVSARPADGGIQEAGQSGMWRGLFHVGMPLSEEEIAMIGALGSERDEIGESWQDDVHDRARARAEALPHWSARSARSPGGSEGGGRDGGCVAAVGRLPGLDLETELEVAVLDGMPLRREAKQRRVRQMIDGLAIQAWPSGARSGMERPSMDDDEWRRLADELFLPAIIEPSLDRQAAPVPPASLGSIGAICCSCGEPCLDPEPCASGGGRCSACVSAGACCMGCSGGCEALDDFPESRPDSRGRVGGGGCDAGQGGAGAFGRASGRKSWCACGRAGCCGCPSGALAGSDEQSGSEPSPGFDDAVDSSLGSPSALRSLLVLLLAMLLFALALSMG